MQTSLINYHGLQTVFELFREDFVVYTGCIKKKETFRNQAYC